ncbi:MAG: hypothetical protein HUU50_20660 [Candidatus Brocadiae bacterium]|nr:hypothetical protein [Candidatus Brocadiia bacterium]
MPYTQLVEFLRSAKKILIFTGAGISTPSGIPDYRSNKGRWKERKPIEYHDFMTSEKARIEFWEMFASDWKEYHKAKPNSIHQAIVDLEAAQKLECVVTQNIDGLHLLAGTSPGKLIELHGTIRSVECQTCQEWSNPEPHIEYFMQNKTCPQCKCGGYLKHATISFGQCLKEEDLFLAGQHSLSCDLVISMGSSLCVYPAQSIPLLAAERGVPYIIINQGPTEHDHHSKLTLRIEGDALEIFPPAVQKSLEKLKNLGVSFRNSWEEDR